MFQSTKAVLAATLLAASTSSMAMTIDINNSIGSFTNAVGESASSSTAIFNDPDSSVLEHGTAAPDWANADQLFYDPDPGRIDVDANGKFVIGRMSFDDYMTNAGSHAQSVDLNISIDIGGQAEQFTFSLGLENNGGGTSRVTFPGASATRLVEADGMEYEFMVFFRAFTDGEYQTADFMVADRGGPAPGDPNSSYRGEALVVGMLVPTAVPLPAAVWLFGTSLLGLVGISRKRASNTKTV